MRRIHLILVVLTAFLLGGCGPVALGVAAVLISESGGGGEAPSLGIARITVLSGPPEYTVSPDASFSFLVSDPGFDLVGKVSILDRANGIFVTPLVQPDFFPAEPPCAGIDPPGFRCVDNPVTIVGLIPGTYRFTVQAIDPRDPPNNDTADYEWVVVSPNDRPAAPAGLEVVAKTQTSVTLRWEETASPDIPVETYRLRYEPDGAGVTVNGVARNSPIDVGNVTGVTLDNLPPCTTHVFTVSVVDAAGLESDPSAELAVRTDCGGDGTFRDDPPVVIDLAPGAEPAALAAADFDDDGRLDLVVANAGTRTFRVLLNTGGDFAPQPPIALAGVPSAVRAGDFDRDGRPEIVVAHGANVDLFRFGSSLAFDRCTASGAAVADLLLGDFNDDARLDVLAVTAGDAVLVLCAGNGNGLDDAVESSFAFVGGAAAAGDFDRDGILDLALARGLDPRFAVVLGDGGSFGPVENFPLPDLPGAIAVADFDEDKILDLAITNLDPLGQVSIVLGGGSNGQGDGSFGTARTYGLGQSPRAVVADDFDLDGHSDVAVAHFESGEVFVLLGAGNGALTESDVLEAGGGPVAMVSGDFDGDGLPDLVTANRTADTVALFTGNGRVDRGDGTFQTDSIAFDTGDLPIAILSADFNDDHRPDLAVLLNPEDPNARPPSVALFTGGAPTVHSLGGPVGAAALSLTSGDFNADGIVDLAVGRADNRITLLLGAGSDGRGAGAFLAPGQITGLPIEPTSVVSGDFNRDHIDDLHVADAPGSLVVVLAGNGSDGKGDGTFKEVIPNSPGPDANCTLADLRSVVLGDFDADGIPDYASVDREIFRDRLPSCGRLHVFLGDGDGTFDFVDPNAVGAPNFYDIGAQTSGLVAADFNRDHVLDLAVTDRDNNRVLVRPGNGNGAFPTQLGPFETGPLPVFLAAADFNGDGTPDLATANFEGGVSVLLGAGNGTFGARRDYLPTDEAIALATLDYDRDGVIDLAVAVRDSPGLRILLGNPANE